MVNFSPLAAEIISLVCGTPANFNGFRVLASLLQRRRSTEANQTLHDVWPSPARLCYIYIFGGCCPVTDFFQVQNSVCVLPVLRSPIGNVTARHSSSGRKPNFAALSIGRHLYSAGRPSRWALDHILVYLTLMNDHVRWIVTYQKQIFVNIVISSKTSIKSPLNLLVSIHTITFERNDI